MEKMRDIVIFVGAGLLVGVAWWCFYVQPADEMRRQVLDCMIDQSDMSEASYNQCIVKIKRS
jgi:hypothetical protein